MPGQEACPRARLKTAEGSGRVAAGPRALWSLLRRRTCPDCRWTRDVAERPPSVKGAGTHMRERGGAEEVRLRETRERNVPWKKWGPYLSERQWGTVREDYSQTGNAWEYLTHDQARSRAYRWGEDGLAGVSDDRQYLCFALALWNGKDPI